ncbi:hypothetical protein [Oceanobacillus rekensis]|uniref:hypothetical protein n=1 Tax=Oceanobacillus rekensis TaxID=937927 RepID=UPI000B4354DC|nr:hypothetical protein [Oceanobacillus rekensis]
MEETISVSTLKSFVEKKIKKKTLIKVIWNDNEKITLFITPNMKINSFIYDEKEGYLFYDQEGKPIVNDIPCILPEKELVNGKVELERIKNKKFRINNESLSSEDIAFLENIIRS